MRNKIIVPELVRPEIAYSIQYEWGQLHMTEAADEAYDITPLTATVDGGSDEYRSLENRPSIDITVVGPDETNVEAVRPFTTKKQRSLTTQINLGIDSDTLIETNQDGISEIVERAQQSGSFIPEDEVAEAKDAIERDIPQVLAHVLAEATQIQVEALVAADLVNEEDRKMLGRIKRLGTTAVIGGSAIALPSAIVRGFDIPYSSLLVSMGYVGAYMGLIHNHVKRYNGMRDVIELGSLASARLVSVGASKDVHASYCRKHFDQQFDI